MKISTALSNHEWADGLWACGCGNKNGMACGSAHACVRESGESVAVIERKTDRSNIYRRPLVSSQRSEGCGVWAQT